MLEVFKGQDFNVRGVEGSGFPCVRGIQGSVSGITFPINREIKKSDDHVTGIFKKNHEKNGISLVFSKKTLFFIKSSFNLYIQKTMFFFGIFAKNGFHQFMYVQILKKFKGNFFFFFCCESAAHTEKKKKIIILLHL